MPKARKIDESRVLEACEAVQREKKTESSEDRAGI
jgi:hypothetical protein